MAVWDLRYLGAKSSIVFIALLVAACNSQTSDADARASSGPPSIDQEWYLTFESDFDLPASSSENSFALIEEYDRLAPDTDEAKWEYRHGPRKKAYTVENNAFVTKLPDEDTTALVLRTSEDTETTDEFSNPFRTGFVRTRNYENTGPDDQMRFAQRFGYFEARMSLNSAPGQWGAFWLMPFRSTWCADSSGRDGTEIDIVEGYPKNPGSNKNRSKTINFAIHYDGYRAFQKSEIQAFPVGAHKSKFRDFDTSNFHTYGFLWTPEKYVWFVDGTPVYEINDPDQISQVPKFLKLSTEVAPWSGQLDPKMLPADTIVDWVRVWQTDTLAAGNPFIFEAEDKNRVNRTKETYTKRMTAGTWCQGVFVKAKVNETGRIVIPLETDTDFREVGIRVSNPRDKSSNLKLYLDGKLEKSWKAVDLDFIFVLKHDLTAKTFKEIELVWDGSIAIDQVYLVPSETHFGN